MGEGEGERVQFWLIIYLSSPHVRQQLTIKKLDVLPDEGYEFHDIHTAALFVLSAGHDYDVTMESSMLKPEPCEQGSIGELIQAMSTLTRVFTADVQSQQAPPSRPPPRFPQPPAPRGAVQNAPQWNQPVNPNTFDQGCMFCRGQGHYVRDCTVATQYIQRGKIIRNNVGKLTLPDGRYLARNIPSRNMRERVNNYWSSPGNQGQPEQNREHLSTNFLETPNECIFAVDVALDNDQGCSTFPPSDEDTAILKRIQVMQAQIDSLRDVHTLNVQKGKKDKFEGVEIPRKAALPPRRDPPPHQKNEPTVHAQRNAPPHQKNKPTIHAQRAPPPQPSTNPLPNGKSGTRARDQNPPRPQGPMKLISMPQKPPADDTKFRYQAAIENTVKASDLADRALDATITVSARELFTASVEARRHARDLFASKKVAVSFAEDDQAESYLSMYSDSGRDTPSAYLDIVKYEPSSTSSLAAATLPLRVIFPTFVQGVEPECILDGGAQMIVMCRDIWEQLRSPITASKSISMESTNSGTTMTLGLIENQPVKLSPITVYLQIQVVEDAPFEVLLGRPFFDVLSCSEVSHTGGGHEIHVRDPADGTPYVFATQARQRKVPRPNPPVAVNFRK